MSADPVYILHFEWPEGVTGDPGCRLEAATEDQARLQAALLYAGTACDDPSPNAYWIGGPDGGSIYHYPEGPPAEDEPRPWPPEIPLPGRA